MSESNLSTVRPESAVGQMLAQLTGQQTSVTSSLNLATPEGRKHLIECMQDCDAKLTEQVNLTIAIKDFVAHTVNITNEENGEVVQAVRLVIIDDKGIKYQCVSQTLLKSLGHMLFLFGDPPWQNPIKVKVKSKMNKQRNIYWFEPVE